MLNKFFAARPALNAGARLYTDCVAQARRPAFYRHLGVKDDPDSRFELYSLHVILVMHRLKNEGAAAAETAQGLFDAYVKSLDDAMREAGVGDLSVGKKMRRLGAAFMGRIKAYDAALGALPERAELDAVVARTVYGDASGRRTALSDYVADTVAVLARTPTSTLLAGTAVWSEVKA